MCGKRLLVLPFELDDRKSRINKLQHGIDFIEADLPLWMVDALDREAARLAVTRQSVIRVWLSERIDQNWRARERGRAPRIGDCITAPSSFVVPFYAEVGGCSRCLLSTAEMQLGGEDAA